MMSRVRIETFIILFRLIDLLSCLVTETSEFNNINETLSLFSSLRYLGLENRSKHVMNR